MAVFYSSDSLPSFNKPVITIGTFDGVHLGHQVILKDVVDHARAIGGESILITFEPHPRKILFPEQSLSLLTPLSQKIEYLLATGIDHIVVQPFTSAFSRLTAAEYVESFLVNRFHPHSIVIGYDHHFGADRRGNIQLLNSFGPKHQFAIHQIPARMIEDAAISSTKIRHALEAGNVRDAASMLGHPYRLEGVVVKGAQLGRTISYPTANIVPNNPDQLIPARGVYAVIAHVGGRDYPAMLNIGFRPTVSNELKLHIEAHLFGFEGDIYDKPMSISFIERLRDEEKFGSLDELKAQLVKDATMAKDILSLK